MPKVAVCLPMQPVELPETFYEAVRLGFN